MDEVRKQLHKEEIKLKKSQKEAVYRRELRKEGSEGIKRITFHKDYVPKAAETLKSFNQTNWIFSLQLKYR